MNEIKVIAPATVSNVVCGFDCLGFALAEPFDELLLRRTARSGISILHRDDLGLPLDPSQNVVGAALQKLIETGVHDLGFEVEITKHIRPGSGIGSSAASACAAVVAANMLLGEPFSETELIEFSMAGEELASGARHADNVAPCIMGGFVLVRSVSPLDVVRLDTPPIFAVVLHPLIEIKTAEARALLPEMVPLTSAVQNWSNLGAFVAAMGRRDFDLMSRSLHDMIVEPRRHGLIPFFSEMRNAGLDAGAIGGGISGSGPSVFMLCDSMIAANRVESAMRNAFLPSNIGFNTYVSQVSPHGVRAV